MLLHSRGIYNFKLPHHLKVYNRHPEQSIRTNANILHYKNDKAISYC